MAEIEKEEVEFPACATLWQGNCIRWQHLIFLFMYMVQLYKEDWTILHMLGCQAIALPSPEQIVNGIPSRILLYKSSGIQTFITRNADAALPTSYLLY